VDCIGGLGEPCIDPVQCESGFCAVADGVCCDAACDGPCEACLAAKTSGVDGTCAPVTDYTDPDNECSTHFTCDGLGACYGTNGRQCADPGECQSDNCVDGVCCDTLCDGLCESCLGVDTSGSDGTCAPVTDHTDPIDECTGNYTTCNGSGACYLASGQSCSSGAQCETGNCPGQDGVCCDYACDGTCESCIGGETGGTDGICGHVTAHTDPIDECTGNYTTCNGQGGCFKANGQSCGGGGECETGNCPPQDDVCCASQCVGLCRACLQSKNNVATGTCYNIPAGWDPDSECAGGSNHCNGNGGCEW
jgi:hypothetical protein